MRSLADALLAACADAPIFAVLDGAQFDNLPDALREGEFIARSLYLDRGDNNPDQVITAPHLVLLDERPANVLGRPPAQTIPALLDLLDGKPAAVFWQCPAGEEVLFKHLRGINMVLYPRDANDRRKDPEAGDVETGTETHDLVLFRHADANVMSQILQACVPLELARLFGPATVIAFVSDEEWRWDAEVSIAERGKDWPEAARGPLKLCMKTRQRLEALQRQNSSRRIAAYLRKTAPDQTADMKDDHLISVTDQYMREAESFGVKSEANIGKWCYLQLVTNGEMGKQPDVAGYLRTADPARGPDQKIRDLMKIAAFKAAGG